MILIKWFNVYLTLDSFKLGEAFDSQWEALDNTSEFDGYHETILIPTEIVGNALYSASWTVDNSVDKLNHFHPKSTIPAPLKGCIVSGC